MDKEEESIQLVDDPLSKESLIVQIKSAGIEQGDTVLVHSSLKQLGWIIGGVQTLAEAIRDLVGPEGTLVVPTQTSGNSDPKHWQAPPVPEAWWPRIRETMPAFDPANTPTRIMGAFPEYVRTIAGAVRSNHPQLSFAGIGKNAIDLMAEQPLEAGFGDQSPLGRLYQAGAKILLLGVGFDQCTAFHLAEHRSEKFKMMNNGAAIFENGQRVWREFSDPDYKSDDFETCGDALIASGSVQTNKVGAARTYVVSLPQAVDFATDWMRANR